MSNSCSSCSVNAEGWVCRVLRKHPFAKHLIFADVVLIRPDLCLESEQGHQQVTRTGAVEYVSLAVRRGSSAAKTVASFGAGDVLQIKKGHVENAQQSILDPTQRMSIFVNAHDLQVVEAWDSKKHGFFSFENTKVGVEKFGTDSRITLAPPRLAVQCKHHLVERTLDSLTTLCKQLFGEEYSSISVRETSTCFVKSCDRLLLISQPGSVLSKVSQQQLIEAITRDSILCPAIMRIYTGQCQEALYHDCDVLLPRALGRLQSHLTSLPIKDLRMHIYPKYSCNDVLNSIQYGNWNPRQSSHLLQVFLFDGVWSVSVVNTEDSFIGDLRDPNSNSNLITDKKNIDSSRAKSNEQDGTVDVCRAQAKLKEVFSRNLALWQELLGNEHTFQLATDIGASPGGWTSFLSGTGLCQRVLSIDNGDVTIDDKHKDIASYWRMPGQRALDLLNAIMHPSTVTDAEAISDYYALMSAEEIEDLHDRRIDMFCCDANIDPDITLSMLMSAKQCNLLRQDGTVFVITCKNIFRRKEQWEECLKRCIDTLHGDASFRLVKSQHLLANTAKELTISGIYMVPR
ncbi:hypothetical protein EON64_09600 [archaeon]|nr:MAG: hypothetical protein EON64_09600 [archaeon]